MILSIHDFIESGIPKLEILQKNFMERKISFSELIVAIKEVGAHCLPTKKLRYRF